MLHLENTIQTLVNKLKLMGAKYVAAVGRDTIDSGRHSKHGQLGQKCRPVTWAQASGPSAQIDGEGQVDVIVALSLPAGPVERKLSVLPSLQGGD